MNFKKATDALFSRPTAADLARELGVSEQAVKQARGAPNSTGFRSPPPSWELAVGRLARKQGGKLMRLAEALNTKK
jgi:hypothetical protein